MRRTSDLQIKDVDALFGNDIKRWLYMITFHLQKTSYGLKTETFRKFVTYNWVNRVKATGTFVKNSAAAWDVTGNNGVLTGWTVETADT